MKWVGNKATWSEETLKNNIIESEQDISLSPEKRKYYNFVIKNENEVMGLIRVSHQNFQQEDKHSI